MKMGWYTANSLIGMFMEVRCRALTENSTSHLSSEKGAQKVRFSNTALQFQCGTDGNICVYRGFKRISVTDAGAGGCAHACVRVRIE